MSEKDEKLNKGSFLYINDEEKAEWGQPKGYPYKEVVKTVIEWDGNSEDRPSLGNEVYGAYKVSDEVFDNLAGCPITFIAGDEIMELTLSEGVELVNNIYVYGDGINQRSVLVVLGENAQNLETGTYFFKDSMSGNILYVGKMTVSTETIHPMAPEFLPAGAADWSVNDPNAPGYVANRTHYSDELTKVEIYPGMAAVYRIPVEVPEDVAEKFNVGYLYNMWVDLGSGVVKNSLKCSVKTEKYIQFAEGFCFITFEDNVDIVGQVFPKRGIYFIHTYDNSDTTAILYGIAYRSSSANPDILWDGYTGSTKTLDAKYLPKATPTTIGAIKKAAAVADVTAAPTAEEFNALLNSLRDAGILATE